jgi:hypothetical protein
VAAFLNPEFLETAVARVEAKAGVEVADMVGAVELVTKQFSYNEDEAAAILRHFKHGGQGTAGGLLNAITSAAQTLASTDRAEHLMDSAVRAMELIAS